MVLYYPKFRAEYNGSIRFRYRNVLVNIKSSKSGNAVKRTLIENSRDDTKSKILDAAEALFAECGFDAATVKDITNRAGVRLSAVNYHFESKAILFEKVVERRTTVQTSRILESLRLVMESGLDGEKKLHAMVEILVDQVIRDWYDSEEGWRNYYRIMARSLLIGIQASSVTHEDFNPAAKFYVSAVKETFPGTDDYLANLSVILMFSNLLYVMSNNKRIDHLSQGKYRSDDLIRMKAPLTRYIVNGMVSLISE